MGERAEQQKRTGNDRENNNNNNNKGRREKSIKLIDSFVMYIAARSFGPSISIHSIHGVSYPPVPTTVHIAKSYPENEERKSICWEPDSVFVSAHLNSPIRYSRLITSFLPLSFLIKIIISQNCNYHADCRRGWYVIAYRQGQNTLLL